MTRILSQEEIDALLAMPRQSDTDDTHPHAEAALYNFRRPDRVSKEQIRSIHLLHDRFAREMSTSLSAYLRIGTDVTIVCVEPFTYSEFLMSLPDPTVFYSLALSPHDGLGALELHPTVAFSMIDRMLGGRGTSQTTNRALTEIEQNVVDGVVRLILENLSAAWRRILEVQFRIHGRETRPQILQVAAPGDPMVLVVFELRVGDARGMLNVCLPATLGASVPQGWQSARRDPSPDESGNLARNLARIKVPLTAVLQAELPARDILAIRPGDVLALGRPVREPIEVKAWNTVKLRAHPTRTMNGLGLTVQSWVGGIEHEAMQ